MTAPRPPRNSRRRKGVSKAPSLDQTARERILAAAFDLFHAQGVHATGLDRILDASGTGKGQFYHYFSSKDELVLEVLRTFRRKVESGEVPVPRDLKTFRDLEAWFQFFLDIQGAMGCRRSCPVGTMAQEFTDEQEALREEARASFASARAVLVEFFQRQGADGRLPRGSDPESLADFCYTVMQGGLLVAKVERRIDPFAHAVRHALSYVRSLLRSS